jgi:Concanavalin A-like lectin/glucanases superfamily
MTARRVNHHVQCLIAVMLLFPAVHHAGLAQQIAISRIELMPNMPSPYIMRNWRQVALGYDSLVFDLNRTGTYLPLVWINSSSVNYPGHQSFGLHTVVGTNAPSSAEAINCLPALISASLVGIDKTSQNGRNWVLMSEEWFNRRPEQNVYKNHPVDDTGDDWWYITMPNVFFYQLASRYPATGDYAYQFATVADRWQEAVVAMGGSTTPWRVPNMDHRGWYFDTMTPYDAGVHEPEAAGAIAWILYNAFARTGDDRYRIAAEWAMEFLNSRTSNPAYELQLPYGAYAAARMNAELGTAYDVEKLVDWCFSVGPLRPWGAIVGNWGGYDCSGLIGEVNGSNDYAFAMNTFEQIGALVPLVRYDDRFARAIGKWVLNAANAARLFYHEYVPSGNQDSYAWAHQNDSSSVIAYEALRQFRNSVSPFATGDAIVGGWGLTNLALYGSSHAGILGGIIDTTNVPGILRLDVLRTDYFRDSAYATYLYYNPHAQDKAVYLQTGTGQHDLYDAVSNSMVQANVSGEVSVSVPANAAMLISVIPAGGTVVYDLGRMLVNGIVVDYSSAVTPANIPPRIRSLAADSAEVLLGQTVTIYCAASDRDGDSISFQWSASKGVLNGSGPNVMWTAPMQPDTSHVRCIVSDGRGGTDTAITDLRAVLFINSPPVISRLSASPRKIDLNASTTVTCFADDTDGDTLSYVWSADAGNLTGSGSAVIWTAPGLPGNFPIHCEVDDGRGGKTADSITVSVRDFSVTQSGDLVAYYPFNGDAADASGHGNNGTVYGAMPVPDRFGIPGSAFAFDGSNDYIEVPNGPTLNFTGSVTINFWMKVAELFAREQYPLSHGNWERRWKVSISNGRLRWTIKTDVRITDLDSESLLVTDSLYNVTVRYDGSDFEVYLNGELDAFSAVSGQILTTDINLTIGQVLPGNQGYNFKGVLDDIRIYNYALSLADIVALYRSGTGVSEQSPGLPAAYALDQNFPNPFNPGTTIRFAVPGRTRTSHIVLTIFDQLGREVETLLRADVSPGYHSIRWNPAGRASGVYYYRLVTSDGSWVRKMILMR